MCWNKVLMWGIIYGLLILKGNQAKIIKKRGVMDNFNDGLKVAGQMFGINTAADVANLVAKAFSNNNNSNRNKPDLFSLIQKGLQLGNSHSSDSEDRKHQNYESQEAQETYQTPKETTQFKQFQTKASAATPYKEAVGVNFSTSNFITSMLRMVGFDASKLGALAINALIMIASAIGNTIMGTAKSPPIISAPDGGRLFNRYPTIGTTKNQENTEEENADTGPEEKYTPNDHEPRTAQNDATTIDWFLQNSSVKMKRILKEATHTNLADKITDMIANSETEQGQGACLKMLVCKSSPFIWGMQNSIRKHIELKDKEGEVEKEEKEEDLNYNNEKRLLNVQNFFTHLPSIEEYREHGEECEKLYSLLCNTTDLYDKKY